MAYGTFRTKLTLVRIGVATGAGSKLYPGKRLEFLSVFCGDFMAFRTRYSNMISG
jgi:hypothetical protein